jgi:hypothetical protein
MTMAKPIDSRRVYARAVMGSLVRFGQAGQRLGLADDSSSSSSNGAQSMAELASQ